MARKVANGRNKRRPRMEKVEEPNFKVGRSSKRSLREIFENPTVRYIAGGIATAMLARLASSMGDRYPELARFLRENVEGLEGRVGQYRTGMGGGQERESRV
jgi:hypothetical protein